MYDGEMGLMCCTLTNFNLSGEKDDFHKSIKIEYLATE